MKNLTKRQKVTIGVIAGFVLVAVGVVSALVYFDKGIENEPTEIVSKQELQLKLKYNEKVKDEYTFERSDEKLVIKSKDIKPELKTDKVGKSKYDVTVDGKDYKLIVNIDDTRKIAINKDRKVKVEEGTTEEKLEEKIVDEVMQDKTDDLDKLEYFFNYPEGFDLNNEGEYSGVEIKAQYKDNKENNLTEEVKIVVERKQENNNEDSKDKSEDSKDNNKKKDKPNSNSSSSESSNSKGSSSNSSSSNKSNSSSKDKPKQNKPKKDKPKKDKPKSESKPKEEKPAEKPNNKPKPEVKPDKPDQNLANENVPAGAELINAVPEEKFYGYSFKKDLPGGGHITEVSVSGLENIANIEIIDRNGEYRMMTGMRRDDDLIDIYYKFADPSISSEGLETIRSVAHNFLEAYGF